MVTEGVVHSVYKAVIRSSFGEMATVSYRRRVEVIGGRLSVTNICGTAIQLLLMVITLCPIIGRLPVL